MPGPILETERLRLRPRTLGDAEALFTVYGDPEVMRYIPSDPPASLEAFRERLSARIAEARAHASGLDVLAIERRSDAAVIGCCGLIPVERKGPEVELAYHLGRAHWGRGYATEAARACVRWGLGADGPRLDRVIGLIDPANDASRRVLVRCGMRPLGTTDRYYNLPAELFEISRGDPIPE